jgi:hypothetical protein
MTPDERKRGMRAAVQSKVAAEQTKALALPGGATWRPYAFRIELLWECIDALVEFTTKGLETVQFVQQVARMTTEEEMADGMPSEDAVATVNSLIAEARKLTGIDPGHPKVYCVECGTPTTECEHPQAPVCIDCMNGQHEVSGNPDCTRLCHGNHPKE